MKEQYAIHEVAALLGISADAIRLYEKEGLVHPTRNPGNGYRYYNFQEIQRVMGISLYRQLGIGINKIRQLVQQQSFDEVEGQFDRLIEENEREILVLRTRVEKMKYMKQHLMNLRAGLNVVSVKELQDCYILYHQDSPSLQYLSMKQILTSPIFSFGNLCLGITQGEDGAYDSTNLEFIVRDFMLDLTPWKKDSESLPVHPGCRCVYTVVKSTNPGEEKWHLTELREQAEQMGLACGSEGFAFYVFSFVNDEQIDNYFEIYLPIVQKY